MKFRIFACAGACLFAFTGVGSMVPSKLFAQETPKAYLTQTTTSNQAVSIKESGLSLAPVDSAFFSSSLGMGKAWQRELSSGWVAEVRRVPYVQELEAFLTEQYKRGVSQNPQAKAFAEGPIVQDLIALVKDMGSSEIFVFGDKTWCDFAEQFGEIQREMVAFNPESPEEIQDFILEIEKEQIDDIKCPSLVIGFQLTNDMTARNYLDVLEGIVRTAVSSVEPLAPLSKGLKRKDTRNGQMLTLTLSAADIPWDAIPQTDEKADEALKHLQSLIEGRSVMITLAVLNNRGLISISEDPKLLENLGKGKSLLEAEALKTLLARNPSELRSIQYVSGEWRDAGWEMSFGSYFENLAHQLTAPLLATQEDSEELEELQEMLVEDGAWLDGVVADLAPDYEPMLAFAYESDQGTEFYSYDWTPNDWLENAKPMSVTRHAGKGPLILSASRQKWIYELDEIVEAVLEKIPGYAESLIAAGIIEEEGAEKVEEAIEKLLPIVSDLHDAIRTKVVPGLDGNESLLAVAAQWTTNSLGPDAPPAEEPLPLPEIGMVMKLKNKDQFLSGLEDVFGAVNKLVEVGQELFPDNPNRLPALPLPQEESTNKGTRYFYPLGAPAPFDQCEFQLLVNDNVAVWGYSTRQVRELFEERALANRPAWFNANDSVASVGYVDVAGIFKAIKPWIRYAIQIGVGDLEQPIGSPEAGVPLPAGSDILQIWDCFKKMGKAAGTTEIDKDGVTVSHWLWVRE